MNWKLCARPGRIFGAKADFGAGLRRRFLCCSFGLRLLHFQSLAALLVSLVFLLCRIAKELFQMIANLFEDVISSRTDDYLLMLSVLLLLYKLVEFYLCSFAELENLR